MNDDYYDLIEVEYNDGMVTHHPAPIVKGLMDIPRSVRYRGEDFFTCICGAESFYAPPCSECGEEWDKDEEIQKWEKRKKRRKEYFLSQIKRGKVPSNVVRMEYIRAEPGKAYVIINESHDLFPQQEDCLLEFQEWERINIPSQGLTLREMDELLDKWEGDWERMDERILVFASPVPYLMVESARRWPYTVRVFHNDKREKKELPNGKIIMTVAKEGWEII